MQQASVVAAVGDLLKGQVGKNLTQISQKIVEGIL
jgi:hypothetical protein